jgi:biopolymer transport protein TolQ
MFYSGATLPYCFAAFFVGAEILDLVRSSGPMVWAVLAILLGFSFFSWSVIYAKWSAFRQARRQSDLFQQAFRRSQRISEISGLIDRYRLSPLARVCDAGYQELSHQLTNSEGRITSTIAIQRALQIAASEQLTAMESMLPWLATTGAVTPFIGLFGTVWGIIDAFHGLGTAGAATMRAVAPGISEALITTAAGLFTAIPAVIFYNIFLHHLRQLGARMDNFALEFLNATERNYS